MLIAIVDFDVKPEGRQTALDVLLAEVPTVRAMQGCKSFRPFVDPSSDTHVGVLHEWHDGDGFAEYLKSPGFARSGETLRPMMTGAPVSRRFQAELIESVN